MADPHEDDELEETKRIMERLVRTPPKPHNVRNAKAGKKNHPPKPRSGPDKKKQRLAILSCLCIMPL